MKMHNFRILVRAFPGTLGSPRDLPGMEIRTHLENYIESSHAYDMTVKLVSKGVFTKMIGNP